MIFVVDRVLTASSEIATLLFELGILGCSATHNAEIIKILRRCWPVYISELSQTVQLQQTCQLTGREIILELETHRGLAAKYKSYTFPRRLKGVMHTQSQSKLCLPDRYVLPCDHYH